MNIFILDYNIEKCAQYHCDKHVVKMCIEYAQLLSSVHHHYGKPAGYRLTHKNHPCAVWARASLSNYQYLMELTFALGDEYTYRYGKHHKSVELVESLPPLEFIDIGLTPFAKAIAVPEIKAIPDAVDAYREYYRVEKAGIVSWKKREVPEWFKAGLV
jgi:hypothetical protein